MDAPPPAAPTKKVKGRHIPVTFREHMNSFPKKVRNMTLRGVRRIVMQVFLEKIDNDAIHDDSSHTRLPMGQFVTEFLYNKYGLPQLADYHVTYVRLSL